MDRPLNEPVRRPAPRPIERHRPLIEILFVGHAYFLGANDPHRALKAEIRADLL
jgi:hypothetical protein